MARAFSLTGLALFAALCLGLPAQAEEGWPRSLPDELGTVELAAPPQRIVSTAPSLTGILLAMEVPLTASTATTRSYLTDDKGFFTQWAEVADARGVTVLYPNLQFDLEALILAEPDLVVASTTGADSITAYLPALREQDLTVISLNYAKHSWQDLARLLGRATGHEAGAEAAIRRFGDQISELAAGMAVPPGKVTIVGYNLGGSYSIGRPESPHAHVLEGLGFRVVGLPADRRAEVSRSTDFDFVSHENLPGAITGETVFLMSADDNAVTAFLADPVLANLPAVRAGRVYALGPSSFRIDYYSGLELAHRVAPHFAK
ncbi:Fe2+-enterobactin ABC transporter substrate-binding protein [Paracoccus aminophilus]|uniref:Ferrienterobactin-binding periplasmic protein n=1 Tax=Paracoccus aminophilus JCM 7686 TaxID=1367847 RepID=S5XSG0_PARAH|nr:Fe2+-enterobactin ABC transporter substrate-binding protein [Paracoccus aminophilus]AGT10389.1 ferrienterobactin-binding periplasmic protein [Paracoccus aminophilus JCM 7686]